jgi:STE24 endopeptidase
LDSPAVDLQAYLAYIPPQIQQQAADYTHGGHWIILFSALVGVAINLLIIRLKLLDRVRARRQQNGARPWAATLLVFVAYYLAAWTLDLPWAAYTKWWREVHYGLSNVSAGAWFADALMSAILSSIVVAVVLMLVYALIRRAPRTWWLWSSMVTAAVITGVIVIAPVALEPMVNHYQPLPAGVQRDAIAPLASQAGIPADRIVSYDGSKQSNRYTAHVTGLFGTARIAVSDALLQQADVAELRAVVGHEIGHYVLHHALWTALAWSALFTLAFALAHVLFAPLVRLAGSEPLHRLADPAGVPFVAIIVTVTFLLLTPVSNGIVRLAEHAADVYSLEHAREPEGMAQALLKTADYRAATPGSVEEWLFYDHPSIARRIQRALAWRAAHPASPAAAPENPVQTR